MDLLNGYGSESEEEEIKQPKQQPSRPVPPLPAKVEAVTKAAAVTLPNPFSDEPLHSSSHMMEPSSSKRSFTAVAGHSLPSAVSKSKASKGHVTTAPGSKQKAAATLMLPPQLMGRANIATEDIDKLFTKQAPGGKAAHSPSDVLHSTRGS